MSDRKRMAGVTEVNIGGERTTAKNNGRNNIKEKIKMALEKEAKRNEENSRKVRYQRGQEYTRKECLKFVSLNEASTTVRRRLEMIVVTITTEERENANVKKKKQQNISYSVCRLEGKTEKNG